MAIELNSNRPRRLARRELEAAQGMGVILVAPEPQADVARPSALTRKKRLLAGREVAWVPRADPLQSKANSQVRRFRGLLDELVVGKAAERTLFPEECHP